MKKMKKQITLIAMLMSFFAITNQAIGQQCAIPTGLHATSSTSTTVTLSWNAVQGGSSYKFEVQNASGNNTPFLFSSTINGTSYTLSGLTANANYKFKVRTNCGGDHSNWSAYFFFTSGGGTGGNCTAAPGGTSVTTITTSGARLNWNSTGSPSYRVRVEDASGNPVDFNFTATTTNTFYNITGLNSGSNYKFKVRSLCGGGNTGPWSAWRFFTTAALRISGDAEVPAADVAVYPNPANEEFSVILGADLMTDDAKISVYDITGKQVLVKELENNADVQKVKADKLPAGIYHAIFTSREQRIIKKLSIVR
jgi:hypothetical protein